jgi:hypothetical protein
VKSLEHLYASSSSLFHPPVLQSAGLQSGLAAAAVVSVVNDRPELLNAPMVQALLMEVSAQQFHGRAAVEVVGVGSSGGGGGEKGGKSREQQCYH